MMFLDEASADWLTAHAAYALQQRPNTFAVCHQCQCLSHIEEKFPFLILCNIGAEVTQGRIMGEAAQPH